MVATVRGLPKIVQDIIKFRDFYLLSSLLQILATPDLSDELVRYYNRKRLTREILEALVVQAYQTEKITSAEVGSILNLQSRWAVDVFLKQHNAELHYDETDLERDCQTLRQLSAKQTPSTSRSSFPIPDRLTI